MRFLTARSEQSRSSNVVCLAGAHRGGVRVSLEEIIRNRAYALARSGRHIDVLTIETQLTREGYADASPILHSPILRAGLKAICDQHWHPSAIGHSARIDHVRRRTK